MSASDKKKLRKEQATTYLTEKQRQEQAEAKKLKLYTIGFVSILVVVACIAIGVLGFRAVNQSGVFEKNTIAAVVDGHELTTVEMNYYYNDAINQYYSDWYSQYESSTDYYLQFMGLDTTKPMDEQFYDEETGKTWADYFVETALNNAKSDYALSKEATAKGFALPEDQKTTLDNTINSLKTYAEIYGFSNANKYLQAMYGFGSDVKSYSAYIERNALATAYVQHCFDELTYTDADYRKHEDGKADNYNSYTYEDAYLSYTDFRENGEEDENGNVTYTDEQNEAARIALKVAADQLATATSLDELKEMLPSIKVGEDSELAINSYKNHLHTSINADLAKWLSDPERQEGDIAAVPVSSTSTDEDDKETTVVNGYHVVYFVGKSDNTEPMANVRHLLVKFEGGTENEETQQIEYSDEEKAAAKTEAEGYLKTWSEGAKTEESFIELVKEHSDDSSAAEGGLFEDINPDSQYVENFLNWSIDPARQEGDCEVVETEYGYHVMYYVGDDEMNYRDYMIENELRSADHEKWYEGVVESITAEAKDTSRMRLDLVMSQG